MGVKKPTFYRNTLKGLSFTEEENLISETSSWWIVQMESWRDIGFKMDLQEQLQLNIP